MLFGLVYTCCCTLMGIYMQLNVAASIDRQVATVPTCVHSSVVHTDNLVFQQKQHACSRTA